jgi:hypothetical protein
MDPKSEKEGFFKYGVTHVDKDSILVLNNTRQILKNRCLPNVIASGYLQYFTNWIEKSSSFIPISKYFSVKCLKS